MFIPRLGFTKYVSRMDLAFLTDYLERLVDLHPDYQGLILPGDTQLKSAVEMAGELIALLDRKTVAQKGFEGRVCRHSVRMSASYGDLSWHFIFKRFVIVAYLLDDYEEIDGGEEFTASQAERWVERAICNSVFVFGNSNFRKSDAWGVYLEDKRTYRYETRSTFSNSPFDYWGEYPKDKRERVTEMLEILRSHVASYHLELFTDNPYPCDSDTITDHRTFVRYADDRLLHHFGERGLNTLLSAVDISLDQWLTAGEPKPAKYSIGGILLPS